MTQSAYDVSHFFVIKVLNHKRELVEFLKWDDLRWDLRIKYDWYFKYRSALAQVKYPKYEVQVFWGNKPATGKTLDQVLKAKLRAKKAKLTKYRNALNAAKANWNDIFPIEEDKNYQKALAKVQQLEKELDSNI